MLIFSLLEQKGKLGNQLFQIASIIGIAIKNNQNFAFPEWKYSTFFKNQLPLIDKDNPTNFDVINEVNACYQEYDLDNKNYDFVGWFQSEKYFDITLTKHYFTFHDDIIEKLKEKYEKQLQKETILISIRRGDFVDHPDFYQLPINYYLTALLKYFPTWQQYSVFIFSDDFEYIKFHFGNIENCYFTNELTPIEQLAFSTLCQNFIISNSTFSWWCAWFGEKDNSKIIRPRFCFTGEMRKKRDDIDYFPDRWEIHDHKNSKINLINTEFVFSKPKDELIKYYFNYFNHIEVPGTQNSIVNIFNAFMPPLHLYLAILNKNNSFINSKNTIYISPKKELILLLKQGDFGLFSVLFNSENKRQFMAAKINSGHSDKASNLLIDYVGKSSFIKGNRYIYKITKRKIINKIKVFIKRDILKRKINS